MKQYIIIWSAIVFVFSAMNGCGKKETDVIARIDKKVITEGDLDVRINKLPEKYRQVVRTNKRKFIEDIIVDELLYMKALKKGLDKNKDVMGVLEAAKKKILIARLLQDEINDKVVVGEEEARQYYNENIDEFKTPEVFRVSHIMLKTEEDAKSVLLELANGRNFEDLARARSIDEPSAKKGGDIGYFARGQLDPDFEKAATVMKEGDISDVVKTRYGYHVLKLTERKLPSIEKYDDVRERISQNLLAKKKKIAFNELVEKLRNESKIVVFEDAECFKKEASYGKDDNSDEE